MGDGNSKKNIYATPRTVTGIDECEFYHVMDIPGYGVVGGKWDLRDRVDQYLGGVDFKGKRVLELGTASGFLCFYMEKRGAEVVAYDIGEEQEWDVVPYCQYDYSEHIKYLKEYNNRLKNAYWYAHKAHNSKAKVVYGSVYEIPEEIGMVDIATFCSILLHLRDPLRALQNALRLVRETVIVTDLAEKKPPFHVRPRSFLRGLAALVKQHMSFQQKALSEPKGPYMKFLPNFRTLEHKDAWWYLSPEIIVNFLGVLGFEETQVTYHFQKETYRGGEKRRLYTVVGRRTKDFKPRK
jgi:SAM-dependent methyltransferase